MGQLCGGGPGAATTGPDDTLGGNTRDETRKERVKDQENNEMGGEQREREEEKISI